jgi:hypothetical protein
VETPKQLFQGGGELADYPGWYKIDGGTETEPRTWSVVRKPDGTWWWVTAHHIFPTTGGSLRIELGDQITDDNMLSQCDEHFRQLLEKIEEKKHGTADSGYKIVG